MLNSSSVFLLAPLATRLAQLPASVARYSPCQLSSLITMLLASLLCSFQVGTFADSQLSTNCTACLAGTYANSTSMTFCYSCPPGSFAGPGAGASTCTLCDPGS